MPILPIDSGRYGSKEIKKIFEEEQHLQYQLDFEAAVSTAQAHIKMIPEYASDDITKKAKSGKITIEKVKELEFRTLPAVGRTHGQHASIIAFGLKFAVWAAEMAKHIERIEEGKKRFLLCKTLGVVGTGSLMGNKALEVQKTVAQNLGLYSVDAAT